MIDWLINCHPIALMARRTVFSYYQDRKIGNNARGEVV